MKRFPLSKFTFLLVPLLSRVLMTAQAASAVSLNDYSWKIVKSPNGGLDNSEIHGIALSRKIMSGLWENTPTAATSIEPLSSTVANVTPELKI